MTPDISVRPFRMDDLPALVEMLNIAAQFDGEEFHHTVAEFGHEMNDADKQARSFVATLNGQIISFCDSAVSVDYGHWAWGSVHPDYRRQGIGTHLLSTADAYALQIARQTMSGQTVWVDRIVIDSILGIPALFAAHGYQRLRDHYGMRITLDTPFEPAQFPEGITLRRFNLERDLRKVYEAHQEAFRDHWGHVEMPYETWVTEKCDDPRYDPSLWLVAVEGDEIAGVALLRRWDDHQPDLAQVDEFAVRRPWRKRGLGYALLRQSFYQLQQRGFTRVRLGVDAESDTNAVALYERAGMQIYSRYIIYRKTFTP